MADEKDDTPKADKQVRWIEQIVGEMLRAPRPSNRNLNVSLNEKPLGRRTLASVLKQELINQGYVTSSWVHKRSGVSPNTLAKWKKAGVVKAAKVKTTSYYLLEDVVKAIREGR